MTERASPLLFQQVCQLFQPVDGFVQHVGAAGKVHADEMVHRLPEEAGTRHGSYADLFDHPLAELEVGPALELRQGQEVRDVDHHEIGALRDIVLQPYPVQPGQEVVALCGVEGLQFLIVVFRQLQPGHSSLLQGCCRAHGEEVVPLRAPSMTSAGPMR